MDAIKSKITGDAYDKPAVTKDGAMTTQDSTDAHTTDGTSADPNAEGGGKMYEKLEAKAEQAKNAPGQDKVGEMAKTAKDKKEEMV